VEFSVEKDFWVCWILERIFSLPDFAEFLLFKGGTSLSKVYNAIQRFSEDIDLSLSRTFFEGRLNDPEQALSNSQRKKYTEELISAFQYIVTDSLFPALNKRISEELGDTNWVLSQDVNDPGTLMFLYPQTSSDEIQYVRRQVKIELGIRSDDWPAESRTVTPYVAESLPLITPSVIHVRTLAVRRTFWEKATILHAEYHRPLKSKPRERISRHYSDLVQMATTEIETQAINDLPLLKRVTEHKNLFYTSSWASYDTASPGTLRLTPRPERLADLRSDYRGMQPMFFGSVIQFDVMIEKLSELEERINAYGDVIT
jgi:hypothetical protein